MSSETTFDPNSSPAFERWVEDTIRRQTDAHLREVLQQAAEEIYDRVARSAPAPSTPVEAQGYQRADEVREPAAAYVDVDPRSVAFTVAAALVHAVGAEVPGGDLPLQAFQERPPAASPDTALPSTLRQLREQSLSAAEAAARLGVNSSRVRQRLLARTLYGFKDGASWRIPEFQLEDDGRTVPGVEQVFPEIRPSASPVAVARWFLLPWADLVVDEARETVVSPRTWLLEGRDPAPVAAQARVL